MILRVEEVFHPALQSKSTFLYRDTGIGYPVKGLRKLFRPGSMLIRFGPVDLTCPLVLYISNQPVDQ